jgi:hypothetical protein
LLVACGGSLTPTASPVPTPTAHSPVLAPLTAAPTDVSVVTVAPTDSAGRPICSAEHLSAKVVSQEGAAAHTFVFVGISNTGPQGCDLPGPPLLMLLQDSSAGNLDIDHDTNHCDGTTNDCVQAGPVQLSAGVPTPGAPDAIAGQARLVVTIATIELFAPCPSPNVQARYLALLFLGVGVPFLEVLLPAPVELQKCAPQVTLRSFGPAS